MIVVDASALVTVLTQRGARAEAVERRLDGEDVIAPEVIDLEVVQAIRGLVSGKKLETAHAATALKSLVDAPIERFSHVALVGQIWAMRANLTAYDAAYVALARMFGASLLTADARLLRAPGLGCAVELIS